jgi:hypothetical protein
MVVKKEAFLPDKLNHYIYISKRMSRYFSFDCSDIVIASYYRRALSSLFTSTYEIIMCIAQFSYGDKSLINKCRCIEFRLHMQRGHRFESCIAHFYPFLRFAR